jgi:hypothetical protein
VYNRPDNASSANRIVNPHPDAASGRISRTRRVERHRRIVPVSARSPDQAPGMREQQRGLAVTKGKFLLIVLIAALIAAFIAFDFGQYFSLSYLKSQQAAIEELYRANPLQTVAAFFDIYRDNRPVTARRSHPDACRGAIFGLLWGTLIVSFASSIGATLAFLASRFVLRDAMQAKFGDKLKAINAGIDKDGAFYLFTLRLVPAFPFSSSTW